MKVFVVVYRKYSEDRKVHIVAPTVLGAVTKANQIVRKSYGDRVLSIAEEIEKVEVA